MIDPARFDIWRYAGLFEPHVPKAARLTLGEGWTPAVEVPQLARALGLDRLVLKREDANPTGSHKDRGVAFQLSTARHRDPDIEWVVISSSGNAAISAAAYARSAGVRLAAFIAPGTPMAKVTPLVDFGATVLVSPKAISLATDIARRRGVPNLRPSTDPWAVEGFQTIGWELVETVAPVEALFTFASSGASFVAIGRAFHGAEALGGRSWCPAMHVVQGSGAQPIAGEYDPDRASPVPGRVGALGAKKTRRVGEAKRLVNATGGSGWVVTDEEAVAAARLLLRHGIATSLEGAASLAAAGRAARRGRVRSALVVLTGRARGDELARPASDGAFAPVHLVSDVDEAGAVLDAAASEAAGPDR